jgi:opacity protein-like surface antigen
MRRALWTVSIAALGLVAAGAASAQNFSISNGYVKMFGGASWPDADSAGVDNTPFNLSFDYDTGYTLGIAGGAFVTPNIALELEYAYRDADLDGTLRDPVTGDRVTDSGDTTSNSIMFNGIWAFDTMGATGQVRPYIGAGIGGANIDTDLFDDNWDSDTLFAYQVFGGVGYDFAPNWSLLTEIRWFATEDGDFGGPGDLGFDTGYESFDLLVGVSYNF